MARFKILHGFRLKAANKILNPGMLYATENEEEIEQLRKTYVPHGAAEELVPVQPKAEAAPEKTPVDPNDDITLVKGVGAGLSKKLAEKGITTKSGLKAALLDKSKEEEMKAVLGTSYEKVLANFEEKTDEGPSTPEA